MSVLALRRPEIGFTVVSIVSIVWIHAAADDAEAPSSRYQNARLSLLGTHYLTQCESTPYSAQPITGSDTSIKNVSAPSWLRRNIFAPIGVPLPTPRLLTPKDPALKLSQQAAKRRQRDEAKMRQILEKAPSLRGDPEKIKGLGEQIFEVTYGKGVTAQNREDFLIRYGCTGWNDTILETILQVCNSRGVVEMGAGHGQWARAISEAYSKAQQEIEASSHDRRKKHFDFVLAYDDNSNLPLNTHIYNAYTQPHHDYFGNVRQLETQNDMVKVLQSWACRGRVLLLVYPPPGEMALKVVQTYVEAAVSDNDIVIFVGEGRGGANGDDALFDYFESGAWMLVQEMDVRRPPGDKGYEKLFILQRRKI